MDYQLLYSEISQPAYAGMADGEIVAALNATSTKRRRVPIAELQARAMEVSVYVALRTAVVNPQVPDQLRVVCQTVLDLANARFADVDLDNPSAVQMFGALQSAGIISPQQAAAIDALAIVQVPSRATAMGLGVVTEEDIEAARRWAQYDVLAQQLRAGSAIAVGWLYQQQASGEAVPEWSVVLEHIG